ncbi:acyltransferase family protein [Kerstersia sp.]|uniref:acyltransferase family protein n=1 Tax=Kerstersia sp. TaxID=1930783 RepID=UPI003F91EF05
MNVSSNPAAAAGTPVPPAARIRFIDVTRGISILLVVFGHSHLRQYLPWLDNLVHQFRVPLFVFLAGLFASSSQPWWTFLRRKSRALLSPYFFTLGGMFALALLFSPQAVGPRLAGIFWGTGQTLDIPPMWFLPHLWLLYGLAYWILKYTPWRTWRGVVCALALLAVTPAVFNVTADLHVITTTDGRMSRGLPFSLDLLPVTLVFFLLGNACRQAVMAFRVAHWWWPALAIGVLLISVQLFGSQVDLNERVFTPVLVAAMAATAGIYLMLACAHTLNHWPWTSRFLTYCGTNSLFILIFHAPIEMKIHGLLTRLLPVHDLALALLAILAGILGSLLLRNIIVRIPLLSWFYPSTIARRAQGS